MRYSLPALKPWLPTFLAFFIVVICLLPILKTGLYTDDLRLFQGRNSISEYKEKSFIEIANHDVAEWKTRGRFAPLSLYLMEWVFKTFTTIAAYKMYILVMNILAVLSFLFVLKSLKAEKLIPLSLVFYAALVQFRLQYHDSFTAFNGMYQFLAVCMFSSVAFYQNAIRQKSWWMYAVAILLACASVLVSEIGLSLLPFLIMSIFFNRPANRKLILSLLPLLFALFAYMGYVIYLRSNGDLAYDGIATNLKWPDMLPVLEIQLFAAIPFSNLYAQGQIPELLASQFFHSFNAVSVIAILGLSVVTLLFLLKRVNGQSPQSNKRLIIFFAITLWLLPACVLMPAIKYQRELHWGEGYLPVFIQNFGVALLLAFISQTIFDLKKGWGGVVFVALFFAGVTAACSAFLFNSALLRVRNYVQCIPADALYRSVKSGILTKCEPGSDIILTHDYYWQYPDEYEQVFRGLYNRKFKVYDQENWKPGTRPLGAVSKGCYLLDCGAGDTVYTRLYQLDCATGARTQLLSCDTALHDIRLSELEIPILLPRE